MLLDVSKGKTYSQAACDWLKANKNVWNSWIPKKAESKPLLSIGYIGRFSGELRHRTIAFYLGYRLAVKTFEQVTNDLFLVDSASLIGNSELGSSAAIGHVARFWANQLVALQSELSSSDGSEVSSLSSAVPLTHMIGTVLDDALFSKANFPSLCSSNPSGNNLATAFAKLCLHHQWYEPYVVHFASEAELVKITQHFQFIGQPQGIVIRTHKIEQNDCKVSNTGCLNKMFDDLASTNSRVVLLLTPHNTTLQILLRAHQRGIIGPGRTEYQFVTYGDFLTTPSIFEELMTYEDTFAGLLSVEEGVAASSKVNEFETFFSQEAPKIVVNEPLNVGPLLEPFNTITKNNTFPYLTPSVFYGYDSTMVLLIALNSTVKEILDLGLHPVCLTMQTLHPSCLLSETQSKALYDEISCTGSFNTSSCVVMTGVKSLMTSLATGNNTLGEIAQYSSLILLKNIHKTSLDGLTGNLAFTGECTRKVGIFDVLNTQPSLGSQNTNSTSLSSGSLKLAKVFSFDTSAIQGATKRDHVRTVQGSVISPPVYAGSSLNSAVEVPSKGVAVVLADCARDTKMDEVVLWYEDFDGNNFNLELNIISLVSVALVSLVTVVVSLYIITQLSKSVKAASGEDVGLLRRNADNYLTIIFIVVEFFQVIRIPLDAAVKWNLESTSILNDMLNVVGLEFNLDWYFFVIVVAVIVWSFYALAYYLNAVRLIARFKFGRFVMLPAIEYLKFLSTAGFIPVVDALLSTFNCARVPSMGGYYLISFCKVECESNARYGYMSISLFLLMVYLPICCLMGHIWQELEAELDLKMYPPYFSTQDLIKYLLVLLSQFFRFFPIPYLTSLAGLFIIMLIGGYWNPPSARAWVNFIIALRAVVGLLSCIVLLGFEFADTSSPQNPLSVLLVTYAVLVLVAFIAFRKYFFPIFQKSKSRKRRITMADYKIRFWFPFKSGFLSKRNEGKADILCDNQTEAVCESLPPWEELSTLCETIEIELESFYEDLEEDIECSDKGRHERRNTGTKLSVVKGSILELQPSNDPKAIDEDLKGILKRLLNNIQRAQSEKFKILDNAWKRIYLLYQSKIDEREVGLNVVSTKDMNCEFKR